MGESYMKYKIGVFGSAIDEDPTIITKARELGYALSRENVTILTGAAVGMPYQVVVAAKEKNPSGEIWEYAPCETIDEYKKEYPNANHSLFSRIFYIPSDFPFIADKQVCRKYRNVISTATSDAGIIISGRWGTLNEYTNLIDFGKVIGVFTGTGGVSDQLQRLQSTISKPSTATVLFDDDPSILVEKIMKELRGKKK